MDDPNAGQPEERKRPGVEREYCNDRIVVYWEPRLCVHVANCLLGLPQVFDVLRRPWVEVDNASPEEVAGVVMTCPSGALSFERLDDGPQEQALEETQVAPQPNGPLYLHGRLRIVDRQGRLVRQATRLALCRCGHSRNKPFCNNSHRLVGFRTP